MFHTVAVGGGDWARTGPFDLFPLLGVFLALIVARVFLDFPFTGITVTIAIAAGTLWAWAVEVWGFSLPTLAVALAYVLSRSLARRPHPR